MLNIVQLSVLQILSLDRLISLGLFTKFGLSSILVALITSIAITVLGAFMLPTVPWIAIDNTQWTILTISAIAIVFGYLFSVMAMRHGETSFIAPFRYTAMIWAIMLGVLFFNDWPDELTLIGTGVIVATGIYSFHREQLNHNRQTKSF